MKFFGRRLFPLALLCLAVATCLIFFARLGTDPHKKLQADLSKPVEVIDEPPPAYDGTPRRDIPEHVPHTVLPPIPQVPSDQEVSGSRIFAIQLWPVDRGRDDAAKKADNSAVGELLRRLRETPEREKAAAIEGWLSQHPDSRWYQPLKHELMSIKFQRGYFAEARQGWDEIWEAVKKNADVSSFHLGSEVLARLLDTNIGLARSKRLRELAADAEERPLNGALEGKVFRAREAVWLLEHTSAQNVMCGPLALNAIREFQREPYVRPRLSQVPASYIATGLPMTEVQRMAREGYGLNMQPVRRGDAAAAIPTPAVMHVKDDHFNALLQSNDDGSQYFLEDRTLHFAGWVDRDAVDRMSSGSFLIASADLPTGWSSLTEKEARNTFGRDGGHGSVPPGEAVTKEAITCKPCEAARRGMGMPEYDLLPFPGALRITDTPLGYVPPVGPPVFFTINYNDMDDSAPTTPPAFSNVGVTWSIDLVAWVEHISGTLTSASKLRVHVPGGGVEVLTYNPATSTFGPHDRSFAQATKSGITYTRELPGGWKEVYATPDSVTAPNRIFLTQLIDPRGNALTRTYDTSMRVVSITDAIGKVTTFQYGDPNSIYRITSVTDPFARTARLQYDGKGRLVRITDVINIATTFTYDGTSGFIKSMTTPYGVTTFSKMADSQLTGNQRRILEVTDPQGDKERLEFNDVGSLTGTPGTSPGLRPPPHVVNVGGQVVSFLAEDARLQFRNSWFWDKEAMHHAPGDYAAARNYRWFTGANAFVTPILESIKSALEDRVYFNYPGSTLFGSYAGTGGAAEKTLRVLSDGSPQLGQSYTNALGRLIKAVDPLGRTTEFTYDTNLVDLLEVRQTTGGVNERLVSFAYNANHQPLTVTDSSGQETTFLYNGRGQVLTATNAKLEVTTFTYDTNGFLLKIDGPLAGTADSTTFTYDAYNRVRTVTGPDGYQIMLSYDALDRLTRVDYPDATFTAFTYDKLDRVTSRDRLGRTTNYQYNKLRQLVKVTDPLARVTQFEWCRCGDLRNFTDPMGRVTRWQRDVQGRVIAKEYPDGSKVSYDYDSATSRVVRRTDEKSQQTAYDYYLDGSLKSVAYPNAQVATPTVSYTYDSKYSRVLTMTDGIGLTQYAYNPVTGAATLGAGRLASVDGPFANDTITYSYDQLGRVLQTAINAVPSSVVYDPLGRVSSATNVLGTFSLTYDGATRRPLSLARPNGVRSDYSYFDNAGDRRLKQIAHRKTDNTPISAFGYTYDAAGRILSWSQQQDAGAASVWNIAYDDADQLKGVAITQGGVPGKSYAYTYDAAGNRLAQAVDGLATNYSYNILNELTDATSALPAATYEWDAENRLTAIVQGSQRSEFSYDGRGLCRRIKEINNGTTQSNATYVWRGLRRAEERESNGATVAKRFSGTGMQVVSGAKAGNYFYTRDHLGSISEVTNGAAVLEQRVGYSPYGEPSFSTPGFANEFGYTGHFVHSPSALLFAPYRAYSSSLGRWLSRDPIGERGGPNLYGYVRNSPIRFFDPLGFQEISFAVPPSVTVSPPKVSINLDAPESEPETERIIHEAQSVYGMNAWDSGPELKTLREKDCPFSQDPNLRNAEHALFATALYDNYGPGLAVGAVLLYDTGKVIESLVHLIGGGDLIPRTGAYPVTPFSSGELFIGLRGAMGAFSSTPPPPRDWSVYNDVSTW